MARVKGGAPFLLDTHIWLWHLAGDRRLPQGLRSAIDGAPGELFLSPVSIWEAGLLARRGRIGLPRDLRAWTSRAAAALPMREAALTNEIALSAGEVELPHGDPADRFIVATALVHDLTLMTVDALLADAQVVRTRSS